jgi:hypothetical protein
VDKPEVLANLTLSFRHIEDAIMRLGKTIQALDGGVSCYDETAKRCTDEHNKALVESAGLVEPFRQSLVDEFKRNTEYSTGCGGKVLHQATIQGEDPATLTPVEQKVCACKELARDRRIESADPVPAPFHAVPAKTDCCRAPVGERHDPACCNSKSYSP